MTKIIFSYAVPGQQPALVIREHDDGTVTMTVRTRIADADGDATLATIDMPWPVLIAMGAAIDVSLIDIEFDDRHREAARALCQRAQELNWPPDTD